MPPIRFFALKRHTLFTTSIFLNKEIISPCSYYAKKGLVYIIITAPSSRQLPSCSKYIKVNTCLLYNVYLVPINKYIFLNRWVRLYTYYSLLISYLSCYRVSGLIYY